MKEGYISQNENDYSTASGKRINVRTASKRETQNQKKRAQTQQNKSTLKMTIEKYEGNSKRKMK